MSRQGKIYSGLLGMLLCALFATPSHAKQELSGAWQCNDQGTTSALVFQSENSLTYNGEPLSYMLQGGVIYVLSAEGVMPYPYALENNNLAITFPDGRRISCAKGTAASAPQPAQPASPSGGASALAQNRFLSGNLCSWSGSSTYTSSYSSSRWVSFDGRGRFTYGSSGSFSSTSGGFYRTGGDGGGSYTVGSDAVELIFDSGGRDTAKINMRQQNGQITELMYGSTLYGYALCQ